MGDRVRVDRDEARYASRGTWPQFRNKVGTVVEVNRSGRGATEFGVAFGKVTSRTDGRGRLNWDAESVFWFKAHELSRVRSQGNGDGRMPRLGGDRPTKAREIRQ